MKMLYTANGRYIRCCTEEGTRPVIIVCEKEYEVDVQEFMLWSILNWRILREEEISSFYEKMASSSNVTIHRSWQDCVQRLLVRGLIVVGTGDTEYDALYDVLDKLYDDNDLNCDNFAHAVREYRCSREVITAVSNLYLRQQIMLDTY